MIPAKLKLHAGQALVAVLLLTMLVTLLGTQTLTAAWQGLFASQASAAAMAAQATAEGAIDFAMAALNSTIPGGSAARLQPLPAYFVAAGPRTWRYADEANGYVLRHSLSGQLLQLTIEVPATVPLASGPGRPEDYRILTATARTDGRERQVRVIAAMEMTEVESLQPVFKRAILSAGNLQAGGADSSIRTDSYTSTTGPYGGANVGDAGGVHANGDVVGGGIYRGSVTAVGSVDPDVTVTGPGNLIRSAVPPETLPSPPPAPAATAVTWHPGDSLQAPAGTVWHLGGVTLSGSESLTLLPGTYVLASLQITGGARLVIPGGGLTTLHVTGTVDVGGNGIATTSQTPLDLRLIVGGPTVRIAGNGVFHGLLQAPSSQVQLGGMGVFFGAVIGASVTFNGTNSTLHYDEAAVTVARAPGSEWRPSRFRVIAMNLPASP